MTRGQFVLFTDTGIRNSTDFNGGMAPDRKEEAGGQALILLPKLEPIIFDVQIRFFNDEYFKYDDESYSSFIEGYKMPIYEKRKTADIWYIARQSDAFDLTVDYFQKYGGDYTYIKNGSTKDLTFKLEDGEYIVKPSGWFVTSFDNEIAKNEDHSVIYSHLVSNIS